MIITKLKKNLFYTKCEYCDQVCENEHYEVFDRVIENNKIKEKNHKRLCKNCKDEFFPDKKSESKNDQGTLF